MVDQKFKITIECNKCGSNDITVFFNYDPAITIWCNNCENAGNDEQLEGANK